MKQDHSFADIDAFRARRERLLATIGDGIAIIPTAPEAVRNRDAHYTYRFDSYFWYLTGFPEPDAVLVLIGGKKPKSILFCREKNEEREIWDGFRYGPKDAKNHFGFDITYPIGQLGKKLPLLLTDQPVLWYFIGQDSLWDARIAKALKTVHDQSRAGTQAPHTVRDLRAALDAMRLVKDRHEIDTLRRAADIASAGHRRAMRACRPGAAEFVLEAELTYEFRQQGASGHAYSPIVAGGANACILHYVSNDQALADSALVLIDAGCEVAGYAADITRTFPVNGRFSAAQKEVYEIVLAAQEAAVAEARPGRHFMEPHEAALKVLVRGMVDLGLLSGTVDGLIESGAFKRFFMHRTSHWLGLDVHDAGAYKSDGQWTTLGPGMVLTVEPGLYIRAGDGVPPALADIGIRIEDDVLITDEGCAVYTTAPKTVAEIEQAMRHD